MLTDKIRNEMFLNSSGGEKYLEEFKNRHDGTRKQHASVN